MMKTPLEILTKKQAKFFFGKLHLLSNEEMILTLRSMCFYSKAFFAWYVCVRWTSDKKTGKRFRSPKFHKMLWTLSSLGIDCLCIVSRGFGKTTAMKIDVLHSMCFQTEQSTLYIAAKGLGEEIVGDIRFEIETNSKIHLLFGSLMPKDTVLGDSGKRWRQRQLQLGSGISLETITKGEPIRGKRPTRVIVDDPQEIKDVRNPRIAEEFWVWFWTSVYNSLNPGQSSVFILGTIISDNCFVNLIRGEAEQKNIRVVEYAAIKDFDTKGFDGELLWPERWTKEMLEERYEKIGKDNFLQEFQNIARPFKGSMVFRNIDRLKVVNSIGFFGSFELFVDFTDDEFQFKQMHIGGDTSEGSASSDYQSIVGRSETGALLFQLRALIPQDVLVKEFDEFIRWVMSQQKQLRIAINIEINSAHVFMDHAKKYTWFRLMRHRKVYDGFTNKTRDEPGFRTTASTKPILMASLQDYIDAGMEVTKIMLEEINKFVFNEKGQMGSLPGTHDDTVIANATSCDSIKRGNPGDMTNFFGTRK